MDNRKKKKGFFYKIYGMSVGGLLLLSLPGATQNVANSNPRDVAEQKFNSFEQLFSKKINPKNLADSSWRDVVLWTQAARRAGRVNDFLKATKRIGQENEDGETIRKLVHDYVAQSQADSTNVTSAFRSTSEKLTNSNVAERLAQAFAEVTAYPQAIVLYQQTARLTGRTHIEEISDLYEKSGNAEAWAAYLTEQLFNPQQRAQSWARLDRYVRKNGPERIEQELVQRVQREPSNQALTELLITFYLQTQQYGRALTQEKALDRRMQLGGSRVYNIATLALDNRDTQTALNAVEYIQRTYPTGQLTPYARRLAIGLREQQVRNTYPIDKAAVRELIREYYQSVQSAGGSRAAETLRSIGNLYANYLGEKDSALTVLDQAIAMGRSDQNFVDRCKLEKGDIFILKEQPWEASLLYLQVERTQKDDLLGYEAKFKSAKLHYYKGEFFLAKELLDILKQATSREIANDAEQLSLIIMDNTGMDSNETALRSYAHVELMLFQNQFGPALDSLNAMQVKYDQHPLADEIRWLKAKIYERIGQDDKAVELLRDVVKNYGSDILGDDALFNTARITEKQPAKKVEALKLYEELLTKYPGSIFTTEARKRYRVLRGDNLN